MTRLEAYRAALRAAVRDGDVEVARQLTKACFAEMGVKTSQKLGRLRSVPSGRSR
jgi:hypothetical protein